jgi:ribosomal-protein-alanine N-acetyltransferase
MNRVSRYQPESAQALAEREATATPYGWSTRNYQDSIDAAHIFYRLEQGCSGTAVVMPLLDEAELLNIFITAEQQGQGLGQALLSGLMADLKQHGYQRLFLEVVPVMRLPSGSTNAVVFRQAACAKTTTHLARVNVNMPS